MIQTNAASSRLGTTTAVKKSLVVGLKSEKGNEVEHVLLEDLMAKQLAKSKDLPEAMAHFRRVGVSHPDYTLQFL